MNPQQMALGVALQEDASDVQKSGFSVEIFESKSPQGLGPQLNQIALQLQGTFRLRGKARPATATALRSHDACFWSDVSGVMIRSGHREKMPNSATANGEQHAIITRNYLTPPLLPYTTVPCLTRIFLDGPIVF